MDKMDLAIVQLLRQQARLSWQDIGRHVHLSGQAVAMRVQRLRDEGVIKGFHARIGGAGRHLVTVFMTSQRFDDFERYIRDAPEIVEASKTAGEGCYHLVVETKWATGLEPFLTSLLTYGTYRVHTVVRDIK
jgi:Lrp/AsnC family leucine-responsive transcriptional regulator